MECVIDGVTLSPLVDMVLGGAEVAIEGGNHRFSGRGRLDGTSSSLLPLIHHKPNGLTEQPDDPQQSFC